MNMEDFFVMLGLFFIAVVLPLTLFAAWVTHVIVSIQTASWVLLVMGAIVFPIGIIHGIGVWFGLF